MLKKTTSLTLTFSGLVMLVSSIVLYLGPAGQVAHFCPWTFWGLGRHYWGMLHLNSGLLFCLAMLIHTYLNWSLLMAYINSTKPSFSPIPVTVSFVLTLYVCLGGCYNLPPMKQLLGLARASRMSSIIEYGSPPYGSAADYPAARIAKYMGWDPRQSMAQLAQHHIAVQSPKQSLNDLAKTNHITLGNLLDIMRTDLSHKKQ